jgi:small subunit ribosomal protein S1
VTEPEEDFATLFAASEHEKTARVAPGHTVEGTIVAIGAEVAFVDIGGKGEAEIAVEELRDDDGALEVGVGDRVRAVVVSDRGGIRLSRKLARGAASAQQLEDAFHSGLAVEGRVDSVGKGGYEIRLGGLRAFCPFSQIDTIRGTDPAVHVGSVYAFRMTEYQEHGRNIVLSRRLLLEEEQQQKAGEIRRSIVPGAVLTGRVTSVREFGAFVDLGAGVQGLLHVSEMGWARVADTTQVVAPGQAVTVKVLRVDEANGKIALGLKQLTADPWSTVDANYAVGQVRTGRVTRLAEFGAFVELEPGIEGLAHASTFPPTGRADGWMQTVAVDMTSDVEILSIDPDRKRIGVALVAPGTSRSAGTTARTGEIAPGARLTGTVERHEPFGVFVFLAPGRTGLIPMSETGVANEADVVRAFPVGSDVSVIVLDVDASSRRIRLSHKAVALAQEAEEMREYARHHEPAPASLGSLADKLRGALKGGG